MDAPPIHYARTDDGVNIAYWTLGEGPALVVINNPGQSHTAIEWELPSRRCAYEMLAADFTVVRFDPRSSGLSDDSEDLTLTAFCRDFDAVALALGNPVVSVIGYWIGSLVAAAVAGRVPGKIRSFVALHPILSYGAMTEPMRAMGTRAAHDMWRGFMDPTGVDPSESLDRFGEPSPSRLRQHARRPQLRERRRIQAQVLPQDLVCVFR